VKRCFESFRAGDRLVLAGDILDVCTGSRYFLRRHPYLFDALRTLLARGVAVTWIEGNHDFNLAPAFLRELPGIEVAAESWTNGTLWVEHGDRIDRQDFKYHLWRRINRSWWFRTLTRIVPDFVFENLGAKWSRNSLENDSTHWMPGHGGVVTERIRLAMREFARQKFDEGLDAVVLGHVHVLDDLCVPLKNKQRMYMNVGFPPVHGTLVRWDSTDGTLVRSPLIP
jgi:UDP-2,3-diacylglucosamine pyrophosphatase LpxH